MVWQYYGQHDGSDDATSRLYNSMQASNFATAGLRGCQFSCYALLEGEPTAHFIRMAQRAGNLFSERECDRIKIQAIADFTSNLPRQRRASRYLAAIRTVWRFGSITSCITSAEHILAA